MIHRTIRNIRMISARRSLSLSHTHTHRIVLLLIKIVVEYCQCADDLPMLITEVLMKTIDMLKVSPTFFR